LIEIEHLRPEEIVVFCSEQFGTRYCQIVSAYVEFYVVHRPNGKALFGIGECAFGSGHALLARLKLTVGRNVASL
jgi:hypothetical protein